MLQPRAARASAFKSSLRAGARASARYTSRSSSSRSKTSSCGVRSHENSRGGVPGFLQQAGRNPARADYRVRAPRRCRGYVRCSSAARSAVTAQAASCHAPQRDPFGPPDARLRLGVCRFDRFYQAADPQKDNLCLYGHPTGTWTVELPAEEVPPETPEPSLGINFARDGMSVRPGAALASH